MCKPGHWEGDPIIGKNQASQIGTLVKRCTGFGQLLHLPASREADVHADAMIAKIGTLPQNLWKTLTWDQGYEMAAHPRISSDAGVDIYFCDPHSLWQSGSNENTNGLLRQYFPKGTDLSVHSAAYLDEVAAELNNRPRKRFDWVSPATTLDRLLHQPRQKPLLRTNFEFALVRQVKRAGVRLSQQGQLHTPDTIPLHAQTAGRNPDLNVDCPVKVEEPSRVGFAVHQTLPDPQTQHGRSCSVVRSSGPIQLPSANRQIQ